MQIPLQIRFHNVDHSDAVEDIIRKKLDKLDRAVDRITSCHVTVEVPHRKQTKGNIYQVKIEVILPRGDLIVNQKPGGNIDSHEDLSVAINDAFDAIARQLNDRIELRRGQVKTHEGHPRGVVIKLFAHEGYGFIEAEDLLEIYFHKNSVLHDGFSGLKLGSQVQYTLIDGEGIKGPQASSVKFIK